MFRIPFWELKGDRLHLRIDIVLNERHVLHGILLFQSQLSSVYPYFQASISSKSINDISSIFLFMARLCLYDWMSHQYQNNIVCVLRIPYSSNLLLFHNSTIKLKHLYSSKLISYHQDTSQLACVTPLNNIVSGHWRHRYNLV